MCCIPICLTSLFTLPLHLYLFKLALPHTNLTEGVYWSAAGLKGHQKAHKFGVILLHWLREQARIQICTLSVRLVL